MKQIIKKHLAAMMRGINQRGLLTGSDLSESHWGLAYHRGDLCIKDMALKEVAAKWGTPLLDFATRIFGKVTAASKK